MKIKLILCIAVSFILSNAYSESLNSQIMTRLLELEELNRKLVGENEDFKSRLRIIEEKIKLLEKQAIDNYNKQQELMKKSQENTPTVNQSESSKEIIEKSEKLIKENKLNEAANILYDFLANRKNDIYRGQAFFELGNVYEKKKQNKKAITAYLNSVKERPNGEKASVAMLNTANLLYKSNQKEEAKCVLEKLVSTYKNKEKIIREAKDLLKKYK